MVFIHSNLTKSIGPRLRWIQNIPSFKTASNLNLTNLLEGWQYWRYGLYYLLISVLPEFKVTFDHKIHSKFIYSQKNVHKTCEIVEHCY